MRSALRMMCRIAPNDGTMRYGLRAGKLAQLCRYSVATVHWAGRYLVEHGLPGPVAGASPGIHRPGRQGC
jgi:hypothetical protein